MLGRPKLPEDIRVANRLKTKQNSRKKAKMLRKLTIAAPESKKRRTESDEVYVIVRDIFIRSSACGMSDTTIARSLPTTITTMKDGDDLLTVADVLEHFNHKDTLFQGTKVNVVYSLFFISSFN